MSSDSQAATKPPSVSEATEGLNYIPSIFYARLIRVPLRVESLLNFWQKTPVESPSEALSYQHTTKVSSFNPVTTGLDY